MKSFAHRGELPAAAGDVIAVITDAEYLRARYESPELDRFEMTVDQDDPEGFAATVSRTARPRGLPAFANRLLGERATLIQTTRWGRRGPLFRGEFRLRIEGLPGQVFARLGLEDAAAGTAIMQVDGQVEAPVPLLGRRIESLIAERAQGTFAASLAAIRTQLEESS